MAENQILRKPGKTTSDGAARKRARQTALFVQTYRQLRPRSRADYDRRRPAEAVCARTVMGYNGVPNWTALLRLLGLPKNSAPQKPHPQVRVVQVHHDMTLENERKEACWRRKRD